MNNDTRRGKHRRNIEARHHLRSSVTAAALAATIATGVGAGVAQGVPEQGGTTPNNVPEQGGTMSGDAPQQTSRSSSRDRVRFPVHRVRRPTSPTPLRIRRTMRTRTRRCRKSV